MAIINCTPHDIVYRKSDGSEVVFPASGNVVRVLEKEYPLDARPYTEEVKTVSYDFCGVVGFPENTQKGDIYIVSSMARMYIERLVVREGMNYPTRNISPDTGKTCIRNDKGHIIAVTQFVQ